MMRLALAWEYQARALGGLPRTTQQKLAQLAGGKSHTAEVRAGIIRWRDKEWRSLSEVARAITGTRWSGPAFFGLKQRLAG